MNIQNFSTNYSVNHQAKKNETSFGAIKISVPASSVDMLKQHISELKNGTGFYPSGIKQCISVTKPKPGGLWSDVIKVTEEHPIIIIYNSCKKKEQEIINTLKQWGQASSLEHKTKPHEEQSMISRLLNDMKRKMTPDTNKISAFERLSKGIESLQNNHTTVKTVEKVATTVGRQIKATATPKDYAVLGLSKGASVDEIKQAYRRLTKEWHPDATQHSKQLAEEKIKEISEAYSNILD
ncbi:MAG: DnaJ domain-containing protein [bacterium]